MTRRDYLQLGVVVTVGVGAGAYLRHTAPIGRDMSRNAIAQRLVADRSSPESGPADADIAVVIFSDFQCPACRLAEPELLAAAEADGRIRLVYRDWPVFGARSEQAARVALASAYQHRYEPVHHALMTEPRRLEDAVIRDAAERAGATWAPLQQDLARHSAEISSALSRTRFDAFALGLPGTPGYLIGPLLVIGAQTRSGFGRAITAARRTAAGGE